MKPVVSSLVALAIALAPLGAYAKPTSHAPRSSRSAVHGGAKKAPRDAKIEKSAKIDRRDKSQKSSRPDPIVRVKAGKKDGLNTKTVVHHAHNVDLAGPGHREPKVNAGGVLVQASLRGKEAHKSSLLKPARATELPSLPPVAKPSKAGTERAARKPAAAKHDASADDSGGEPARDEEFAELVARIRGISPPRAAETEPPPPPGTEGRETKGAKTAPPSPKRPCMKDPVEIVRGPEVERFELVTCDGSIAPLAVEHLSILMRPGGAARPTAPVAELAKKPGAELAHGVRRVDPRLVQRIEGVAERFGKPGAPAKLFVISGHRPASVGSMHATGRAIDLRVEGVRNEDVVAFCKTLGDTGCGFYPNSSFVHIDVRDAGAGHVSWIDVSGPGESPRYVTSWPPRPAPAGMERTSAAIDELFEEGERLLRANRPLERDPTSADEQPDLVPER